MSNWETGEDLEGSGLGIMHLLSLFGGTEDGGEHTKG
jgi:hypothetical protein